MLSKKFLCFSLILLLITISAVSAEDNTTSDLHTTDNIDEAILKENKTFELEVDENIEVLPAQNQIIDIRNYPDDAKGNITITIDGESQILTKGYEETFKLWHYNLVAYTSQKTNNFTFDATNLTFGQHDYEVKFMGDDKYLPTAISGTLTVSPIIFSFPSEIYLYGTENRAFDDFKYEGELVCIKYLKNITGNVSLYINERQEILCLSDYEGEDIIADKNGGIPYSRIISDESGQFYIYRDFIQFDKPTNLTAVYGNENYTVTKSAFVNVAYNMDCEDEIIKGEDLEIFLPKSMSKYINLEIDGNPVRFYSSSVERDYTYIYFFAKTRSLDCGNHTINMTFKGNDKYPASSICKTFYVIENPVSPKMISIYHGDSKTCDFTIYGTNRTPVDSGLYTTVQLYSGLFNSTKQTMWKYYSMDRLKTITNEKGQISYKIPKNLNPGKYTITVEVHDLLVNVKLIVKHVVTLKDIKVKKSSKKLVLKATLKNEKALENEKVTFKFNGKTYNAKTNRKGIAKVTIKQSALKKLKAGKKIIYSATYLKDTVKKTVKVQK